MNEFERYFIYDDYYLQDYRDIYDTVKAVTAGVENYNREKIIQVTSRLQCIFLIRFYNIGGADLTPAQETELIEAYRLQFRHETEAMTYKYIVRYLNTVQTLGWCCIVDFREHVC
jgi:hypothetical protein